MMFTWVLEEASRLLSKSLSGYATSKFANPSAESERGGDGDNALSLSLSLS